MSEEEEFEFRLRLEREQNKMPAQMAPPISQARDVINAFKRVPALTAGLPGDVETLGRLGINYLREQRKTGNNGELLTPVSTNSLLPSSQDTTNFVQESLGIDQTAPVTPLGRTAELVGFGGMTGLARGGVKAASTGLLRDITKPVAGETVAALGASAARESLMGAGVDSPMGLFLAEAAGGLGASGAANLTTRMGRSALDVTSAITNFPQTTIGSVRLPVGAANIAGDVLRQATPEGADLSSLVNRPAVPQTVADQLNSPVLKSLEQSLEKEGIGKTLTEAVGATERAVALDKARIDLVSNTLKVSGSPNDFFSGVSDRMSQFSKKLSDDIRKKSGEAESALKNIGVEGSLTVRSINTRNTIEANLKAAKATENSLWEAAKPHANSIDADVTPIIDNLNAVVQAQPNNISPDRIIPGRIVQKIKNLGKAEGREGIENLTELQALRSDILDESRKATTEGRFDQARKLNDLQSNVLKIMDNNDPQGLLVRARTESRALNETFRQGEVGKLLGLVGDAEDAVKPLNTLDDIFAPTAAGNQAQNVDDFFKATGQEGVAQAEEFLRAKFKRASFPDGGDMSVQGASSFLRNNEGALEMLPNLRREIEDGINTAKRLDRQIVSRSKSSKSVQDRSNAAVILGSDPRVAVSEVLRGRPFRMDSVGEVEKLMRSAKTPAEKRGLTRAVFDHVADQSFKDTQEGTRRLDLVKLTNNIDFLSKSKIFAGDDLNRLKGLSKEIQRIQKLSKSAINTNLSLSNESLMTDIMASVLGARIGGSIGGSTGGGSIQTASRTASLARKLVSRLDQDKIVSLLEEAIYDPQVFKTLHMRKTPNNDTIGFIRLRGHLLDLNNDLEAMDNGAN